MIAAVIYFKTCPRCAGDVRRKSDEWGEEVLTCIQCGKVGYVTFRRIPLPPTPAEWKSLEEWETKEWETKKEGTKEWETKEGETKGYKTKGKEWEGKQTEEWKEEVEEQLGIEKESMEVHVG
jgi:hypothetical protein